MVTLTFWTGGMTLPIYLAIGLLADDKPREFYSDHDLLAHGSRLLADGFRQILLSPVASIMVGVICAFFARRRNLGEPRSPTKVDYLATFVFLGLMLGVMLAGYAVFRWLWFFEWMDD